MKFWVLCWRGIGKDAELYPCDDRGLACLHTSDADVWFSLEDLHEDVPFSVTQDSCWQIVELET